MKTEEKTGKIKQNPADLTIKTLCNSNKQLSQVYKLGKDSIIGLLCDASWSRLFSLIHFQFSLTLYSI